MKRVPVQYLTLLIFPTKELSPSLPKPLTGYSSAGQRAYWGSSISYVLSYND